MNDYILVHHGIQGQKWGVRRFQNEDGSLTPAGIERYRKGEFDKNYAKSNDGNLFVSSIPKGTSMYRVTDKKEKLDGSKYMTMFEPDRDYYRADGAKWIAYQAKKSISDLKEDQYVLTKDIKLPTVSQQNEIIQKNIIDNKKNLNKAKTAFVNFRTGFSEGTQNALKSRFVIMQNPELKPYATMMQQVENQFDNGIKSDNAYERAFYATAGLTKSKALKKALEKEFSNKGYDGMTDYAGVGGAGSFGRETRQAMIIFDTKKNLQYQKSKQLNDFLYNHANENWKTWYETKSRE